MAQVRQAGFFYREMVENDAKCTNKPDQTVFRAAVFRSIEKSMKPPQIASFLRFILLILVASTLPGYAKEQTKPDSSTIDIRQQGAELAWSFMKEHRLQQPAQ